MIRALAMGVFAVLAGTGAHGATYNFSWTGNNGYTMEGQFSFANSLLGTGVINHTQISDLTISIQRQGRTLARKNMSTDGFGSRPEAFNLNFDTVRERFLLGGLSTSQNGQNWFTSAGGSYCDTIGFSSGLYSQGVCVDGYLVSDSFVNTDIAVAQELLSVRRIDPPVQPPEEPLTPIVVEPVTQVPLPAALPLLLSTLVFLMAGRRLRQWNLARSSVV